MRTLNYACKEEEVSLDLGILLVKVKSMFRILIAKHII